MIHKGRDNLILIGYWNNERNGFPEYPHPKDMIKEGFWDDQNYEHGVGSEFFKHYLDNGIRCNQFRGSSSCRICGKNLGSFERHDNKYIWPDQLSHYLEHDVILPEEFIKYMRYAGTRIISTVDENFWKEWNVERNGLSRE